MPRTRRIASLPGHRVCNQCNRELPANPEIFARDKSRLLGLAYECRECMGARKKGKETRQHRWFQMTPEERTRRQATSAKYVRSQKGRSCYLRKAYERIDACDLTSREIYEMIIQPCCYCGTTECNRGLDRIDNTRPHVKGNVQTACSDCNRMRADRFSVAEMMMIGGMVAHIRANRETASQEASSLVFANPSVRSEESP